MIGNIVEIKRLKVLFLSRQGEEGQYQNNVCIMISCGYGFSELLILLTIIVKPMELSAELSLNGIFFYFEVLPKLMLSNIEVELATNGI